MFSLLNIAPENIVWFYLAPVLFFGPVFFAVLWNFGLKNLFHTPPEFKEQRRLEREHNERITQRRASKTTYHARAQHQANSPSFQWVGQAVLYASFALVLGVFSAWPGYRYNALGMAQIKLSLSHPGERVEPCHKLSLEELAKLAPNMRAKMACARERWPVAVELTLDGAVVFEGTARAAGLHQDGSSSFYEKIRVPAGPHALKVRLNDAGPQSPYTYVFDREVELVSGQNLVIGFSENSSGFFLK